MAEVDAPQFSLMGLEDELTCSICLSPFECPVTIPCGHNFCQDCLLATWKDSYSCPQCRTFFATKPELKKNTVLSTVVETFKVRSSQSEASLPGEESKEEKHDVIRCDTCMEAEASQTCLTCMASFCEEHLRPHRDNPIFRLHQLSEPVGDLSERICPDHHKLMELFCSQHDRPICSVCLQQVHKGCSFTSPEEQRNLKESDFRYKLGLLDGKIEKTDSVIFQMNDMQSNLKEAANKRKSALAAVYQQVQDILAQDEREAQHEVDRELEIGQMKLRDLLKKLTGNSEKMTKAREYINSLLSQSQTLAFLQASFELPKVIKFEPHMPRINLDSKKVLATQTFAAVLKENLMELLKQPVEARLPLLQPGEKAAPVSRPGNTESSASQPESEPPQPAEQKSEARCKCPGHLPVQPYFLPIPMHISCQHAQDQSPGSHRVPPFSSGQKTKPQKCQGATNKIFLPEKKEKKTVCKPAHKVIANKAGVKSHTLKNKEKKNDTSQQAPQKQDKKPPSAPGGNKPAAKGSDSSKKDKLKSHPPSAKSTTHHPHPNKNK